MFLNIWGGGGGVQSTQTIFLYSPVLCQISRKFKDGYTLYTVQSIYRSGQVPEPVFVNVYGPENRSRGFDSVRLGIDSWVPFKVYKYWL